MATFRISQCQDGDEVEDVRAHKDALENLNTGKSTSRFLTGVLSQKSEKF